MKHTKRVDIYGKIKNVRILRRKSAKRAKLCVATEVRHDIIMLPVTVWESNFNSDIDLLAIGTTVHIIGKVRVQNQTATNHVEKTVCDIVAYRVELM